MAKQLTPEKLELIRTKDYFDCIAPSTIKFMNNYYIVGDSYRCVWAIREYPPSTEEQAMLSKIADRNGVTLRIYHRLVDAMEQKRIVQNAMRKNKMKTTGTDVTECVEAEGNLQDVIELLANIRRNRECLLHCAVFIELKAKSLDELKDLQSEVAMELTRSKISVDRLTPVKKRAFFLFCLWASISSELSSNGCCLQALWQTFIPSIIRARPIPTDSISDEINTARISS